MNENKIKQELLIKENNTLLKKEICYDKSPSLSMNDINIRIEKEICYDSILKLTDAELLCDYEKSNSVKNKIKKLENILDKYLNSKIKQKIIQEYLLDLIPAGTKGVIRGNKFNDIIKNHIINLKLDKDRFEICFEKNCKIYKTSEIPDWYIFEKSTNKIIIGITTDVKFCIFLL